MPKNRRQNRPPAPRPPPAAAPVPGRVLWRRELGLGLGLGLLILVFYANSFSAGLTIDNGVVIAQDARLHAWTAANLQLIFTKNYWWPVESDLYRPLTTLSYLFNYAVLGSGERVASYHLVNLLLHWINAWLVLIIVRRLGGTLAVAALAAALFAVHPVNVEAVTNIVGRADLLATLGILAGGWCYVRAAETPGARKWAWRVGAAGSACLGVLAKESAIMICAFVVLYDWVWRWPKIPGPHWRARLRAAARECGPALGVALAPALLLYGWIRYWFVSHSPVLTQSFVDNPIVGATPVQGFLTAISVLGRYLGLLVFPHKLSADYSYHQIPLYGEAGNTAGDFLAWASLAAVLALLGVAWRWRARQPLLAWGILFFLVMQLPTSNLLVLIGSIMAERFLYLPSIGFCVVAALALCAVGKLLAARLTAWPAARRNLAVWTLPALVLGALGLRTYARNADWRDNSTVWKSVIAVCPESFKGYKGYASALWDDGARDEPAVDAAIAQAQTSLAILDQVEIPVEHRDETVFVNLGIYYQIKGKFLADRGQADAARVFYQKAVDMLGRAVEVDRHVNQAWHDASLRRGVPSSQINDIGNFQLYLQLGRAQMALQHWDEAAAAGHWIQHILPDELSGPLLVGDALAGAGRWSAAAVPYLQAIMVNREGDEAWQGLLHCYTALGLNPPPVVKQGDHHYDLFDDLPAVRQQMNEAGVELVKSFTQLQRVDDAHALRDRLIRDYKIPAELFAD